MRGLTPDEAPHIGHALFDCGVRLLEVPLNRSGALDAFRALAAGAQGLKLFPAEMITPPVVKALRSILPTDTQLLPVGSISPDNMRPYIEAGANGFGIGGQLYKPGIEPAALKRAAESFMLARQTILQHK